MAELRCHEPRTAGFTLVEMLAALMILLLGVTALVGALSASVGNRRTSDARHEMSALCDLAVHRVQQEAVRADAGSGVPQFVALRDQEAPGFPGMLWSATATADEARPELWLVQIDVRWPGSDVFAGGGDGTGGEADGAGGDRAAVAGGDLTRFLRVIPRQLPLRDRVVAFRGEGSETSSR